MSTTSTYSARGGRCRTRRRFPATRCCSSTSRRRHWSVDAKGSTWLLEAAERAGIAPHRVVLEVTERFGARTDSVVACLRRLRDEGFRIALDDVGTGNSGLEMLQKVNADFVKIDRSIVLAAPTDRNARAVLMAMATYARQTGSYVIAEGIEDQDTLDFLGSIGERDLQVEQIIQGGQGFGLGRPVSGPLRGPPAAAVGARSGLNATLARWRFRPSTSSWPGG